MLETISNDHFGPILWEDSGNEKSGTVPSSFVVLDGSGHLREFRGLPKPAGKDTGLSVALFPKELKLCRTILFENQI